MELRKLFHSMISVPNSTVTPEQELARLTLISSSTEENIRRNSILSPQRPSLSDIGVSPSQEPRLPSASSADNVDIVMVNGPGSSIEPRADLSSHTNDEVSSEETLVEVPTVNSTEDDDLMIIDHGEQQQRQENILQNKENLAPSKADDPRPSAPEHPLLPLAESSPSRANEQAQNGSSASASVKVLEIDTGTSKAVTSPPRPPNRPPPVPPRQKPEEQKRALQEEVEFGAQQDVTEVIANVLFQLQCAIKPESIDESGEQIDQIKRLFFGKQKSYTTNERGEKRWKEEFFSDIKVDVASGPRDIYAALDGAFDEQEVEVNGSIEPQYATISLLPPVLQILVQRAQFDPARKISFKSINHLEMRETIYMDRYVDSTDPELEQRRKTCWDWKKQVAALEGRRKELTTTEVCVQCDGITECELIL
jgi:ubiquitin carboxyl-terminal hydrolase 25/28